MLRLIKTLLFVFAAFWAGVLYERNTQADKCLDRGDHIVDGVCYGES
jgi:hypothetical protein